MRKYPIDILISVVLIIGGYFALMVLAFGCHTPRVQLSGDIGFSRDIEDQKRRAVVIVVECLEKVDGKKKTVRYYGSGVIVGEYRILTANHVASHCKGKLKIILPDATDRVVRVIVTIPGADVAVLESLSSMRAPSIEYGNTEARDEVCIVPAQPNRMRTCGTVSGLHYRYSLTNIYHGAKTYPGNSGAGLYNVQGELVGIVTQNSTLFDKIIGGIATSINSIRPELGL